MRALDWAVLGSGVLTGKYLSDASAIDRGFPHDFLAEPAIRSIVYGDHANRTDNHRPQR